MEAYKKNTKKLQFIETCKFGKILEYMWDYVNWHTSNGFKRQYFVLLIITTGRISDKKTTIEKLIQYSKLPLSVIFVGVGDGDFTDMEQFNDSYNKLFSSNLKEYAIRDIVQFVPFNNFDNPQSMAKQVFMKLSKQSVEYMALCKTSMDVPESSMIEGNYYAT